MHDPGDPRVDCGVRGFDPGEDAEPEIFVDFANSLALLGLRDPQGQELTSSSVVDPDLCYAFYFNDPYGNTLELDCYDHASVERDLIQRGEITPVRFW